MNVPGNAPDTSYLPRSAEVHDACAGAGRKSVEKSIHELGCQYLDLCLVHWPDAQMPGTFQHAEPDTGVTMQETWCAAAPALGRDRSPATTSRRNAALHPSLFTVYLCQLMPM